MRYLDLCTGISALTVACAPLGWEAVGYGEIEPFPSAVLAHHYPRTCNFGDITQYANWKLHTPPDLVAAGTPCQGFSMAGLRGGLDDPRSALALVFLDLASHFGARWLVWENVAGVLSIDRGRAFGAFLGRMGQLGYGFAYRVLNARHFGIANQRRRVFVVGYRGNWRRAAAVLSERASLSRSAPASRGAAQVISAADGAGACGGRWIFADPEADELTFANAEGSAGLPYLTRSNVAKVLNNQTPLLALETEHGAAVRRFTPVECERLLGFPDNYTLIPWQNRTERQLDVPRYAALGNSKAVPVVHWLAERIARVDGMNFA